MSIKFIRSLLILLLAMYGSVMSAPKDYSEEYRVSSIPNMPSDMAASLKQYAGQISLDSTRKTFFWFMESKMTYSEYLVIWLNGGPGCSSMDGVFFEVGPFRFTPDGTSFQANPDTWQRYAHMLFIDQPVGVGFSQASTPDAVTKNMDDLTEQFTKFLDRFYEKFPAMKHKRLILSGESFAGAYIPYIAAKLMQNAKDRGVSSNIKSIVLGNPWMDSESQYRSYVDYSAKRRLVDRTTQLLIEQQYWSCADVMQKLNTNPLVIKECEVILQTIENYSRKYTHPSSCINVYKVTESDPQCGLEYPSPHVNLMVDYLRRSDVQEALHIKDHVNYQECSQSPIAKWARTERSSVSLLPGLLEADVQVFLYFGTLDLICNYLGAESMLSKLTWQNMTGFAGQPTRIWCDARKDLGTVQEARGLHYYTIYGAGHMAPYDAGGATLEILRHAIAQKGETYFQDDLSAPCNYMKQFSWYAAVAVVTQLVSGIALFIGFQIYNHRRNSVLVNSPVVIQSGSRAGYARVPPVDDAEPHAVSV